MSRQTGFTNSMRRSIRKSIPLGALVALGISSAHASEWELYARFLQAPEQGKVISITGEFRKHFFVTGLTAEAFMKGDVINSPAPQVEGFVGVEVTPGFLLVRLTQGIASTHGFKAMPLVAGHEGGPHFAAWAFPTTATIAVRDRWGFIGVCFRHYSTGESSFNPGINFYGAEFGVTF